MKEEQALKHITKKAVSLFLALWLTFSCAATAMAAQTDARQTNFFSHGLYHTDLDFSELEYKHIEAEPILEKIKNIRELMGDAANAAEVERMFWEVDEPLLELETMLGILTIHSYLDVNDEESANISCHVLQKRSNFAFERVVQHYLDSMDLYLRQHTA